MAKVNLQEIEITSQEGTQLATLARQVREKIENYCSESSGWVQIFCGFRTPNGERTDNDIVVFGSLNNLAEKADNTHVKITTFAAVIECKAHSRVNKNLFFEGNDIKVKYQAKRTKGTTYTSACTQADECARSIKEEIYSQIRVRPYVESFVWLYNYNGERPQQHSFACSFSAENFFQDLAHSAVNKKATKSCIISTNTCIVFQATGGNRSSNYNDTKLQEYAFSRTLKNLPSKEGALTRKRVERITKKSLNRVNQSDYFSEIGEKMLAFIGGPGTGKTASLIYSAKWLAEDGQRLLLLTYNHVLKCDLKRLIYYAGLSSLETLGVNPKSSTLFFTDLLCAAKIVEKSEINAEFFDTLYQEKLDLLLQAIRSNSIKNLDEIIFPYTNYDLVMIDEAQDWPIAERDLIFTLWGSENVMIASSPDQLTRGGLDFNDWTKFARKGVNRPPRRKCLRQAKMLVEFNTLLMKKLNYEPLLYEPADQLGGEKIFLYEGAYNVETHSKILHLCELEGQDNYDICLACHQGLGSPAEGFNDTQAFYRGGFPLWDACNNEVRKSYPIGDDKQRIMFYESSRGIEAWAFFSIGLDTWLEEVIEPRAEKEWEEAFKQLNLLDQSDVDSKELSIKKQVSRWALIALTRAVAINIINVDSLQSKYGSVIHEALSAMPQQCWEIVTQD